MKWIGKRLFALIVTLSLLSILTFYLFTLIPGDAALAQLGNDLSEERLQSLREEMGLDRPLGERYLSWLSGAVRGDFGESYQYKGSTVASLVGGRMPATVALATISFLLLLLLSIPLGVLSARCEGTWVDAAIGLFSRVTMAVPTFFLGIMITYLFGLALKWFRPGGFVPPMEDLAASLRYLMYPALAIALPKAAMVARLLRSSILGEVDKDYVRTAYAKGCGERDAFYGHILQNAFLPVVTYLALLIAEILAGSVVVEQVFGIPGIGKLLVGAIANRDYPVVQAVVLWITTVVVALNAVVDAAYHFIDPRVKE